MTHALAATAIPAGVQAWNYSVYHILTTAGPHGGSWWAAARALADWGVFPLAFMLVALFFFGDRVPDARLAAIGAGLAVLAALVVNQVLGHIWFEPRPFLSAYHVPRLAPASHGNSFPSDHLAFAGAIVGALWMARRRQLAVVAAALAAGVGWARIVGGIHWPLDVMVGLAVGLISGAAVGTLLPRWGTAGRLLGRGRLGPVSGVVGSMIVVAVGFTGLELRGHLGLALTELTEGVVAIGALGIAWSLGWTARVPGLSAPKESKPLEPVASDPAAERPGGVPRDGWGRGTEGPEAR